MMTGYYEYGVADYSMPRRADGSPRVTKHRVRVEIIEVGPTRTKVRFLEWHIDGRGPGTITSVKNRNVTIGTRLIVTRPTVEYRRPYKDD